MFCRFSNLGLYQTHSLRSFWSLLLPWPRVAFALYAVSTLAVLLFAIRLWKSESPLSFAIRGCYSLRFWFRLT